MNNNSPFSPLISIIVPVYNVGKYLNKCIDSIVQQTYSKLEIILVDDGSTDNSSEICDHYSSNDKRIKVIHKINGGLSDARNVGLDLCTGDYVTFIDGDDWYEYSLVADVICRASKASKIISFSSFINHEDGGQIKELTEKRITPFNDAVELVCNEKISCSVCTKFFSKDVIEGIHFRNGRTNEDFLFLMQVLLKNNGSMFNLEQLNLVGYHYYMREGSITHSKNKKAILDAIDNCSELLEIYPSETAKISISRMGFHQSFVALNVNPFFSFSRKNVYFSKPITFVRKNKKYLAKSMLKHKEKITCYLFLLFPHFTAFFVFFYRRLFK